MPINHIIWGLSKRPHAHSPSVRFGVALLFAAAVIAANFYLSDSPPEYRYFLFTIAVFSAAAYGGFIPGVVITLLLGAASSFLFLIPLHSLRLEKPGDLERLAFFLVEGIVISAVGHVFQDLPPAPTQQPAIRYGLSISLAAGLMAVKFLVFPQVARQLPFALCYALVVLCAWLGGVGPALVSTFVSTASAYVFFVPRNGPHSADERLIVFLLESGLLALLIGTYRASLAWTTDSLRRVFLDSPAGMVVVSTDFRILKANPSFCKMLARTRAVTEGINLSDLLHPKSREWILGALRDDDDDVEREPVADDSFKFVNGAQVVATQMQATSVGLRKRGKRGWLIVVQDVTERENAERRLLETEARLRQAEKLEAVGLLASSIAHEFNNTLGVIIGYGEQLVQNRPADELVCRNAQEISQAAHRSSEFARALLGFTRRETGKRQPVDLNTVILDCRSFLVRLLGQGIDLVTELGKLLPPVEAIPGQIEQVLMNLAANARDAMPRGGNLTIHTDVVQVPYPRPVNGSMLSAGRYVTMRVADDGQGMDSDTMSRIFEPFFTTKPRGTGTGLGLATVARSIGALHGHITVESVKDRGTIFTIYLPASDAFPENRPQPIVLAQTTDTRKTVLVVEDQDSLRRLMAEALGAEGYRVLQAEDYQQAIASANGVHVDLLLTDMQLPGVSGAGVAKTLLESHPHLRVLFMSGDPEREEIGSGQGFLAKPFGLALLSAKVREILHR